MHPRFCSSYVAAIVVLLLVVSGCNRSATSALPPSPLGAQPAPLSPDVWERGATPVQWAMFTHPASSTHYASPVADRANNIWFESDGKIERINYSGSNLGTLATITSGTLANLALGGDGNVWYGFTSLVSPKTFSTYLYAVSSSGAIVHEYRFASNLFGADSGMVGVSAVAPGIGTDMWETGVDNTGRGMFIRLHNGQAQLFGCGDDSPGQTTVTQDGTVWFLGTNSDGDFIDEFDPRTGHCREVERLEEFYPHAITVGPDHNVWTIDTGANGSLLIRTKPATGVSTRFGIGLHYVISDIIAGPDGNLWASYTTSTTTGVMKISTSAAVLGRFTCPTSFCHNAPANRINGLTNAPDGNIWFSYNGVDRYAGIGAYVRLSMTVTPSSVTLSRIGATQLLKIAEANYSGTWSVASATPSIVKVVSRPAANQALIQAVGVGSGRVIVRDSRNNYYGVTVSVL